MGWWRSAGVALVLLVLSGNAAAQSAQPRTFSPEQRAAAERILAGFVSPTLTRFAGDEEFRRYLGAVLAVNRARGRWWASAGHIRFAHALIRDGVQSDAFEPICPDSDPDCAIGADEGESIVVTGSRIAAPSNPSITNNQMRNVEEGDIVKQIDQFLLVLQDGRIFVIDTRGAGGRGLVLADRMNVYRDPSHRMWYDEMLVFGDRVLITGYSYRERATELSVFRLDAAGRLAREGVFYLSSNDYYSSSNYATRLIGDNLVIYTPFDVLDMSRATFSWPVVRRWVTDEEREGDMSEGRPLFDAAQIYRPVGEIDDPTVHTVSVCPLGPVGRGPRPAMPNHRLRRPQLIAMVCDRGRRLPVDDVARFLFVRATGLRYGADLRDGLSAGPALSHPGRRRRARAGRRARPAARPVLAPCRRRPLPRFAEGPAAPLRERAEHGGAAGLLRHSPRRLLRHRPGGGGGALHAAAGREVLLYRQPLHRPPSGLRQHGALAARPLGTVDAAGLCRAGGPAPGRPRRSASTTPWFAPSRPETTSSSPAIATGTA